MHAFALGLSLGVGAGLAPGPLLALVVRASLERGFSAGARVAVAPLLTDVPIVATSVVLATSLPDAALGALGVAGGLFVIWLGVDVLRPGAQPEAATTAPRDLRSGALVNVLSPHPWVFWVTVGAPVLADGSVGEDAAFVVAFYALLVGIKLAFAALLASSRDRLGGRRLALALRVSGVPLIAAGVLLAADSVRLLG